MGLFTWLIPSYGTERIVFELVVCLFFIILVLFYKSRTIIYTHLKTISKTVWIPFILFLLLYSSVLLVGIPKLHGMWLDESYYQVGAKHEIEQETYSFCYLNEKLETSCEPVKANHGWGFLISICYFLFGVNNLILFNLTILISVIIVFLVFLIVHLITTNSRIAFLSAVLYSLMPIPLLWAGRTESNIPGLLFLLLAIYFLFLFNKTRNFNVSLLSLAFFLFSMQIRIEHILLLPLFFVVIGLQYLRHVKTSIRRTQNNKTSKNLVLFQLCIIFLLLFIFVFGFLPQLQSSLQGRNAPGLYTFSSMIHNVLFQFPRFHYEYLIVPFVLAGIGLISSLFSRRRFEFLALASIFIIYFFFWPSRVLDSNQPRYYVTLFWIIAIFSAYGIFVMLRLLQFIPQKFNHAHYIMIVLQIVFVLFLFLWANTVLYSTFDSFEIRSNNDIYMVATRVPQLIETIVPKDAIIVGSYSEILPIDGATQLQVMKTKTFLQTPYEILNNTPIYFYEGMLSLLPPFRDSQDMIFTNELKDRYVLMPAETFPIQNVTFELYQIKTNRTS